MRGLGNGLREQDDALEVEIWSASEEDGSRRKEDRDATGRISYAVNQMTARNSIRYCPRCKNK
jgi:hypothetical protein